MEVIISIVGSLAAKAAEYTVDPIARQLSYLFKPRTKFLNLRSKVRDLKDARERVQQSVDSANRKGEVIFDDVQRWLTVVDEKISEEAATQLREDEDKATKSCFAGFCPDFKSIYPLSKKADREANAVAQLLIQKDNFDGVSRPSEPKGMDTIRSLEEYEAFESRRGAFDGVMAALKDDIVSIIGVYGMGGVGKTTLVKEAFKQAKEEQLFNEVILVAINQTPNMLNIQKEIAEKLGLAIYEENIDMRATRLCERLKKEKRVLVILDDIWESLDLRALGIPSVSEHKGCKILMTSRKLVVLKSMNSQQNLTIDLLNEEEAWNLFKNVAGHFIERPDLQSTAIKVAQKCAGLPLAITTVAKALKYKENLYEWNDALEQLKPSEKNFQAIQDEAYSAIELSYKYLKSQELKSTFLLCSVMGHDAAIQDLLKHCRGLRLFHGLDTMEKVRNRVLTLVTELKDSSLLLAGSTPERFDMHDVVCDVAISIASRDRGWLALRKEDVFEESSIEDTMRNSELVSLKYAKVSQLPDELECPNLTSFSTHGTVGVPNNFFKRMQTLKVLEFASPGFTSLPSSIGSLKSLCALHLIDCDLENIVILGELEKLEILDLRRSRIKVLPEEIGQLNGLKLLDLSKCSCLEVISPKVLSNLSRLEELYLYDSFDKWEVEGIENPRSNVSLVELQYLSHLTTLELHIPNVEAIRENNLFSEKMERFKISIGDEKWNSYDDREMKTSRMLKLTIKKGIHLVDRIKLLFRKTQSLYLDGMEDVGEMQMFYHPNVEFFEHLKFIKVKNCSMLQNLFLSSIVKRLCQLEILEVSNCKNIIGLIVKKEEIDEIDILEFSKLRILKLVGLNRFNALWYSENTGQSSTRLFDKKVKFPVLEKLEIENMDNLERLWADQLVEHSFSKLTSIKLRSCPKLLNVFPLSMLRRFQRLKSLTIWECKSVEEIIFEEGGSSNSSGTPSFSTQFIQSNIISLEFSNLTSLSIWNLPNLKSIHHNKMLSINWPSLTRMGVYDCHAVEILFATGETSSQQPLFWVNEVSFPALEELEVIKCRKLKYMFTSSIVKSFVQLKTLEVSECDEMEGVIQENLIAKEEEEEGINGSIRVFPKLDTLRLHKLLKLRRFCCGINPVEFPLLRSLNIRRCPYLNTFVSYDGKSTSTPTHYLFNGKVILPALEKLDICEMDNLERLWFEQFVEHSFSKLTSIFLSECPKLLNVFPLSMLTRLQKLDKLSIWKCESVEEMISEEGGNNSSSGMPSLSPQFIQSDVISFEFPNLTSLDFWKLPNLKSIHRKKMLTINWPSLKKMKVSNCHAVEILFANSQETSSQQPLFWGNEFTFPNLHQLTLKQNAGIKEITWHCQGQQQQHFVSQYFPNLKVVKLEWYPEQVTVLPYYLFHLLSLPSLQTLEISHSAFKEMIFQSEGGGEEKPASLLLSQITELKLEYLQKLIHLWKEKEGFPDLRILHVGNCSQIKVNLVPSSVSFRNLVTLKVEKCNGIIKLITHSTAKSLGQLKQMSIKCCRNIEEIVQDGDDDDDDKISFPQLNNLELVDLPKLESFCSSEKYTFGFPSLEFLLLQYCRKMKKFSQGHSNTPMLHKVRINMLREEEERWEGSLDSTIQKLFSEKPKVCYCNMMKNLFSFSTAKILCQLEELEVSYCKNIPKLIEEKKEEDKSDISEFNKLRVFKLIQLSKFNDMWYSENKDHLSRIL